MVVLLLLLLLLLLAWTLLALQFVKNTPALRAADQEISPARVAFNLRLTQSKPIYNAVKQLRGSPATWSRLDPEQQRIIELTLKQFVSNGVGLAPAERKKFNDIVQRLQKLSTNFRNNMLDSTQVRCCGRTWRSPGFIMSGYHQVTQDPVAACMAVQRDQTMMSNCNSNIMW